MTKSVKNIIFYILTILASAFAMYMIVINAESMENAKHVVPKEIGTEYFNDFFTKLLS